MKQEDLWLIICLAFGIVWIILMGAGVFG